MHIRRDGGFIVLDMYQFERQYLNVPQWVWDRVPNNGNNPNPKNGGGGHNQVSHSDGKVIPYIEMEQG